MKNIVNIGPFSEIVELKSFRRCMMIYSLSDWILFLVSQQDQKGYSEVVVFCTQVVVQTSLMASPTQQGGDHFCFSVAKKYM